VQSLDSKAIESSWPGSRKSPWEGPKAAGSALHIGVPAAHLFVEGGLDEGEGFLELGLVLRLLRKQGGSWGGVGGVRGEGDQAVFGEGFDGDLHVGDGGVAVLSVAGVEEPDGCAGTEDAGEPEGFGGEEGGALGLGGVGEDELVVAGGVIAGGDGDGLAVSGFDEFELALVEGLADGIVEEGLGEGLLGGAEGLAEGDGHGGGEFGVERGALAVFKIGLAVDEGGIGTGGGLMEGPGEEREAQGEAGEGEVEVGAGALQALGGLLQIDRQLRGKRSWVEGLGEFEGLGLGGVLREGQGEAERLEPEGAGGGLGGENLEAGGGCGSGNLGGEGGVGGSLGGDHESSFKGCGAGGKNNCRFLRFAAE
jgi:hypothetical protein